MRTTFHYWVPLAAAALMGATIALSPPVLAATPSASIVAADAPASAPTSALDRIRSTGHIVLGYRPHAAPMSFLDASGQPTGYAVALCRAVADALSRSALTIDWVAVSDGFSDLENGLVDLICADDEVTLENRARASFSIPIFPGGVSALVRADVDRSLEAALEERPIPYAPLWRGTPPPVLSKRTYSALVGSATEALKGHIAKLRLTATVDPVSDYDAGVAAVLERRSDVLFGDRDELLDAVQRVPARAALRVLTRRFTFVSLALAIPRNDDDFRLAIDRALTETYASPKFGTLLYTVHFGTPDPDSVAFFRSVGVPSRHPIDAPP